MQPRIKAGVACGPCLSLSYPRYTGRCQVTAWQSEQLPYVLVEQLTCWGYCPSDCVVSHLQGGGGLFNPAASFFLLPKPESAIHSGMDHMLTFSFVCMRQCCCCLYHFWRQVPALLNNGARKSVGLLQQQWSSEKYFHCGSVYLLGE